MHPCVTLCGRDSTLLWTRKLVLERAGMAVQTILGVKPLDQATGGVLVLCHTLSHVEKTVALDWYRSRFPDARVLILGGAQDLVCEGCETLAAYPGPQSFIQTINQLVLRRFS